MRKLLYIVIAIILLAACVGSGKEREVLDRAQSIINDCPDSALAILDSLEPSSHDFSLKSLRRWQLLRLMAQNKCDTVFSDDSLQLLLSDYFDHNGTSNEKMWAYYLLGRAYSDMGEAPIAMRCYQEATACADTTSITCDWWNLSRIYLQLASLYYESYMPIELSEVLRLSQSAAMHAGDTLTSILSIAKQYGVYELKGNRDSAAIVIRDAAQLYDAYGRKDLASQTLSVLIENEVEKGNLEEAQRIINNYEGYSGFFDNNHEIEKGREIYYYSKGIYYLGIGRADSAEWIFRKLFNIANDVNETHAAHLGLRKKFLLTGPKDSLVKYAILSEASNDSLFIEKYNANEQLMHKRYNYSRLLENEQKLLISSEKKDKLLLTLVFAFIIANVVSLALYQNRMRKRKTELGHLSSERMAAIHKYEQLKQELLMMEHDRDAVIEDKKKEIAKLSAQIAGYKVRFDNMPDEKCEAAMQNDNIVLLFREKAKSKRGNSLPTSSDWSLLKALLQENIPHFYNQVVHNGGLTQQELQTCILCRLGFRTGEIAVLLDTTVQRITNVKISANQNLFGKREASSLSANLKEI